MFSKGDRVELLSGYGPVTGTQGTVIEVFKLPFFEVYFYRVKWDNPEYGESRNLPERDLKKLR